MCGAIPATQTKPDLFEYMLPRRDGLYDEFELGENLETGRCATIKASGSLKKGYETEIPLDARTGSANPLIVDVWGLLTLSPALMP
jgi:hypothetical protein